jgi:putative membrane protein
VKDFGKRMETDHSKANDELKSVAEREHLQLPSEANNADQAAYDRLSKLQGTAFDKAYARAMVRDHEKDVAAFEKEASSGTNQQIKDFAQRTLPTLKEHLKQAKEMEKTVMAG